MSLEHLANQKILKSDLKARKIADLPRFALIKGAFSCGKKSLAFYLMDEFFYIDFDDLRYQNLNINEILEKEKIKNLIINEPKRNDFELKNIEKCYILSSKNDYFYKDFFSFNLGFLDYEEFVSFSKKNLSESLHLSTYLLVGQNPMNVDLEPYEAHKNLQKILKETLNENEILAMCIIANFIGNQISILALLKVFIAQKKISKNDFFKLIKSLENRFLIHWVSHISKNVKKPYFSDFAYKNALSIKKDFSKNYENLIANELLLIYDEIFYHDDINFIVPSARLGLLAEAFTNKDFIRLKSKKLNKTARELGIKTILILSLNEQFSIKNDGIKYIGLPLSVWLLSKDLNDWD